MITWSWNREERGTCRNPPATREAQKSTVPELRHGARGGCEGKDRLRRHPGQKFGLFQTVV